MEYINKQLARLERVGNLNGNDSCAPALPDPPKARPSRPNAVFNPRTEGFFVSETSSSVLGKRANMDEDDRRQSKKKVKSIGNPQILVGPPASKHLTSLVKRPFKIPFRELNRPIRPTYMNREPWLAPRRPEENFERIGSQNQSIPIEDDEDDPQGNGTIGNSGVRDMTRSCGSDYPENESLTLLTLYSFSC